MEQQDLLTEFNNKPRLEYATVGQRFGNYIVDTIFIYIVIFFFAFAAAAGSDSPMMIFIIYFIILAYYLFAEGIMKGKTIGKYVTKTTVVNDDGSPITMKTSILRGLSRLVPFEAFSAFGGYPWHDQWTKTRVVKDYSLNS